MCCVWFHLAAPQLSPQKARAAASIRGALTVKKHIIKNLTQEECGEEDGNGNRHFLRLWLIERGQGWAHEELAGAWCGPGNWESSLPSKDDIGCLGGCSLQLLPPADPTLDRSQASPILICPSWLFCTGLAWYSSWDHGGDGSRVLTYPSLPLVFDRLCLQGPWDKNPNS